MTKKEMLLLIKQNLKIEGSTKDLVINDMIATVCIYCNRKNPIEEMEPFIRRKVEDIIQFEQSPGYTFPLGVKSIKDGDGSITFDDSINKETIYGLSDKDKVYLRRFRKLSTGV